MERDPQLKESRSTSFTLEHIAMIEEREHKESVSFSVALRLILNEYQTLKEHPVVWKGPNEDDPALPFLRQPNKKYSIGDQISIDLSEVVQEKIFFLGTCNPAIYLRDSYTYCIKEVLVLKNHTRIRLTEGQELWFNAAAFDNMYKLDNLSQQKDLSNG